MVLMNIFNQRTLLNSSHPSLLCDLTFMCFNIRMDKVTSCFKRRPEAVVRLLCFPWAGGGSIHYARWGNVLSSSIEGTICNHKCRGPSAVTGLYDSVLLSNFSLPVFHYFTPFVGRFFCCISQPITAHRRNSNKAQLYAYIINNGA